MEEGAAGMVVGLGLEAGHQRLAKEIIREPIGVEGIIQRLMEGGRVIEIECILQKLMHGGRMIEIEGILQKLMEGGMMIKVAGILQELMERGKRTEVEGILRKLIKGGMMTEVEDILRRLGGRPDDQGRGHLPEAHGGWKGGHGHRDLAGAVGKGHAGSGRHEEGRGTRSMEVDMEPEVERGFLEIGEGDRAGSGHRPSVPSGGIAPGGRDRKGEGGHGGVGPSGVNTTREEARASARAGFRPMELHMVWNPATKVWVPEGNLPEGLRYEEDEELIPEKGRGEADMFDVQEAMEKQLMLACRMIRGMEMERDHLKGTIAEKDRLLEMRNRTINQFLGQVREVEGQLREAQDEVSAWRSWWDRWEWDMEETGR